MIIAVAMLPAMVATGLVLRPSGAEDEDGEGVSLAVGGLALAGIGALSLGRGARVTAQCEKAHLDYQRWRSDAVRRPTPRRGQ